jgi:polar amino acid transport system substrate-binding protein
MPGGPASIASQIAPTGTLRLGVWMVSYFARVQGGAMSGIIPDLGAELARRAGARLDLVKFENPARMIAAFRDGSLDATFLGVTADRAEVINFGPVVLNIETSYLVPAASGIGSMAEIDRPGVRIAVPDKSAQQAHLAKTITAATLIPVPAETPQRAIDMLNAGEADAFSHVVPMLATVPGAPPGARILPGSYFSVPIAIGVAKGRPGTVAEFARTFAESVKQSGFVQQAIERAGVTGIVTATSR